MTLYISAIDPSAGATFGTTTVAAVGGVATFNDIQIDLEGTGYQLDASSYRCITNRHIKYF